MLSSTPWQATFSRREFLRVGSVSAGVAGVTMTRPGATWAVPGRDVNLILLCLVGGPSQLDTWDPKPAAPSQVRGPFKPIATAVPGMQIGEHFPRMAQAARRYSIIRSVHHTAAPIHETGLQLMQTGKLFRFGQEQPHYGAVLSHLRGSRRSGVPAFAILPGPIGSTGVSISHGQGAGALGPSHEAWTPGSMAHTGDELRKALDLTRESDNQSTNYGRSDFSRCCLQARRLVEAGVRCVTVNMFDTVFDKATWDCHADGGSLASTLDDYRRTLCPMFDQAYSALLDDLADRGLLASTLVIAMGEFGRTPHLNARGGRDHWPDVWSILMAGGGVRGGQVVGSSDALGAEPRDRPVTSAEVAATIYRALGIDLQTILPGPDGLPCRLVDANPINETL
jgi:hypothetical protein